mgnify:CR=1 FL=1
MNETTRIDKIYFMIHPCSWVASGGIPSPAQRQVDGFSLTNWYTALNWEVEVNKRQHELIDNVRSNEMLVIFPSRESNAMRELESHGEKTLGTRCIVCREPDSVPLHHEPKVLHEIEEPIKHFLEDEVMEGRDEFWELVQPELRSQITEEIRAACTIMGFSWAPSALNLLAISHTYAQEISDAINCRGLVVDANTISSEAFGEGFEQCAMSWKSMIPGHLEWSRPIENNFDLSVSGAHVLFDATFRERVALENDIRLFLWERSHGLPMAMFARATARFVDPGYEVQIPLTNLEVEAWGMQTLLWPETKSILKSDNQHLWIPVLSGTAKRPNETCYLVGCNVSYDDFRDILVKAKISEIYP